jgi:hypothetical protein
LGSAFPLDFFRTRQIDRADIDLATEQLQGHCAMMDLEEARVALDYYAALLDLQCKRYNFAASLVEAEQNANQPESRAVGIRDQAVADLRRAERETLVLSILIEEAIAGETKRLVHRPQELARLLEARNRKTAALDSASNLLREHDQNEAEKERERKELEEPNQLALDIEEFRRKIGLVGDPNAASRAEAVKRKEAERNRHEPDEL